jgi:TRAP-type C4-dicarboxylate transport system permease small subunit
MVREATAWLHSLYSLLPAIAFALLALAPAYMPPGYDAVKNSISESAAQGIAMAWVARLGLCAFGLSAWWMAARLCPEQLLTAIALAVFGAGLVASACWSHRPWVAGMPFDHVEDCIHSFAAQLAGVGITVATAAHLITRLASGHNTDSLDWVALFAVLAGSAGFALAPAVSGLIQRGMFAAILLWLWHVGRRSL